MGLLRLLLALSVVADHCGSVWNFDLVGGKMAVQSFYIISGFYMSLILNEKYVGENNSYKLFITNRFLRVYPIYWAVMLLTVLFVLTIAMISKTHFIPKFGNYLTVPNVFSFLYLILTNILIFGQDVVLFQGINPANGNLFFTNNFKITAPPLHSFLFVPQGWTLAIELMFYLVGALYCKKAI